MQIAHNSDGSLKDTGVIADKYVKPGSGIPEDDLSDDVKTKLNNGGVSDADSSTKGVLQLTGDLGGTADSPTVPGLADKLDASGGTLVSDLDADGNKITGLADGDDATDAATKGQVEAVETALSDHEAQSATIDDLDLVNDINSTDLVMIWQNGETKSITIGTLLAAGDSFVFDGGEIGVDDVATITANGGEVS